MIDWHFSDQIFPGKPKIQNKLRRGMFELPQKLGPVGPRFQSANQTV